MSFAVAFMYKSIFTVQAKKCSVIAFNDIDKTGDARSREWTSRVRFWEFIEIGVWILDIRQAYKQHVNVAQLYSMTSQKQLICLKQPENLWGEIWENFRSKGLGFGNSESG